MTTLDRELLTYGDLRDSTSMIAAVVGDVMSFALPTTVSTQTTTLTRKPSGSSASISANGFTADVSGYYTITVAVAALSGSRAFTVVAFPASLLTAKVSRSQMQNAVQDGRVNTTTIAAALEGGATFTLPLLMGGAFIGWSSFGG